jgi:membrane protease YdiL (CAAX protease family)
MDRTQPFPSAVQALLLVVALFAIEFGIDIVLNGLQDVLGLTSTQAGVLGRLVANGCIFATVMQWQGLSWRGLFHPAGTSMRDTAAALVPWVVMLVPALVLVLSVVMGVEMRAFPLSDSERAMFERMAQNDLAMTLLACVIAPTVEEMLFRGVILRGFLQRYSRTHAIWGSAALFGLAHQNIYQFVVALLIGALSGWLYERARSLVPCIALHATYNTSLWLLGHAQAGAGTAPDGADPDLGAWWLASLALAAVGLFQLLRAFRARDADPGPDA